MIEHWMVYLLLLCAIASLVVDSIYVRERRDELGRSVENLRDIINRERWEPPPRIEKPVDDGDTRWN